ncbi:MAG: hypothetical protein JHC95_14675 [Solirubrobacteraceae bacterium]|nr:hypothetical protein [Solirubrobacteraceae bacterium]
MTRTRLTLTLAAVIAWTATSAAHAAPSLKVHATFTGGKPGTTFYGGQPLMATVSGLGKKQTVRNYCWDPEPIESTPCTSAAVGLEPGKATVTAELSDGTKLRRTLTIRKAKTGTPKSIDEAKPPALYYEVTCPTTLYGNYDPKSGKLRDDPIALNKAQHVAVYYRAGKNVFQVWAYSAHTAGFVRSGCLSPAASLLNGED